MVLSFSLPLSFVILYTTLAKAYHNLQTEFGREVPLFEVEATVVEPVFQRLYSYIFDMDSVGSSVTEMDRPVPSAIFIVNFDKVKSISNTFSCQILDIPYFIFPQYSSNYICLFFFSFLLLI